MSATSTTIPGTNLRPLNLSAHAAKIAASYLLSRLRRVALFCRQWRTACALTFSNPAFRTIRVISVSSFRSTRHKFNAVPLSMIYIYFRSLAFVCCNKDKPPVWLSQTFEQLFYKYFEKYCLLGSSAVGCGNPAYLSAFAVSKDRIFFIIRLNLCFRPNSS